MNSLVGWSRWYVCWDFDHGYEREAERAVMGDGGVSECRVARYYLGGQWWY